MKKNFVLFFSFFLLNFFSLFAEKVEFVATYEQWKNKENNFVEYLEEKDQARVIFIGSKVFSADEKGKKPTVSEGMAYGLLLANAYDDQPLFDKFLRYVLEASLKYSCITLNDKNECIHRCFFLMPWMLDYQGDAFAYKPQKDSKESYFSSGSATDADLQIAWALDLAIKKVNQGLWKNHYFKTFFGKADYKTIFKQMVQEIRLYDIDWDRKIILPGSQWGEAGKNVFFAGYFTPQAFEALDEAPLSSPDIEKELAQTEKNSQAYLLLIKNNSAKRLFINSLPTQGKLYPNTYLIKEKSFSWIPPLATATLIFFPKNEGDTISLKMTQEASLLENPEIVYNFSAQENQKWLVEDVIVPHEKSKVILQNDKACLVITDPTFSKLQFSFFEVMMNSAKVIEDFQKKYDTGLVPNILYFNDKYPSLWEKTFSYDAIRYALWTAPYLKTHKNLDLLQEILDKMMGEKGVLPFITLEKVGWTLPAEGINIFEHKANTGWQGLALALNAPVFLYAYLNQNQDLINKLGPNLTSYSLTDKQPSLFDPPNDSSAYFTSSLLLITKALLEGRL